MANAEGYLDGEERAEAERLTDVLFSEHVVHLPQEIFKKLVKRTAELAGQEARGLPEEKLQEYVANLAEGFTALSAQLNRLHNQVQHLYELQEEEHQED